MHEQATEEDFQANSNSHFVWLESVTQGKERIKPRCGLMKCPSCKADHLHHTAVDVFARKEDADTGMRVTAMGLNQGSPMVEISEKMEGNPSDRRGRISVSFWCEGCGGMSELSLSQHKGQTMFWWSHLNID